MGRDHSSSEDKESCLGVCSVNLQSRERSNCSGKLKTTSRKSVNSEMLDITSDEKVGVDGEAK